MFDIGCDKCGNILLVDRRATTDDYVKTMKYLMRESDGELDEGSVQPYIIYKCPSCNESYKFTYKDWEKRYRLQIANDAMEIRKQQMFKEDIDPYSLNPDNGLEYCGQCSGYAGDGTCLTDIIKQCTIRK